MRRVTRWYLKRRTKKSRAEEGETMKKWLVTIAALCWPDAAPAKLIKTITSYLWCERYTKYRQPGQSSVMGRAGHVPDYLAGNGVVYQTSDVKYGLPTTTCGPARWINSCATPWCQPEYATARLGGCLPASGKRQDTLNVTVTEFNGRYDGKVMSVVSGC